MATARTAERPTQTATPPLQEAPTGNLPAARDQQKLKHPLTAFQEYLGARAEQLQFALPSHISPDRFTRIVLTALQRKPELLKCTKQSLWNACLLAAQDGLMPDGREGAIVPYGENEKGKKVAEIATWMPMIEGLRKKARNSGEISDWMAFTVRARDAFRVVLGDAPRIDHEPYIGADDPGEVVAAYSVAWLKDGTISRDVMTIRDLMKIKAKSKATNGPWNDSTFFGEMCKKTIARRHYKQLPHSSDLDDMIKRDDEAFGLDDRSEEQIADRQQRRVASVGSAFDQFAGGPAIDHEADAGDQGEATAGEAGGEFEDVQPTDAKAGAITQDPAKEAVRPATTEQPAGEKPNDAAPKPNGDQNPGASGQQDAGDAVFTEADTDHVEERQPPAEPKNADEYIARVKALADTFTNADELKAWRANKEDNGYMGGPERRLRSACGVFKDPHGDVIDGYIRDRLTALRGQQA